MTFLKMWLRRSWNRKTAFQTACYFLPLNPRARLRRTPCCRLC